MAIPWAFPSLSNKIICTNSFCRERINRSFLHSVFQTPQPLLSVRKLAKRSALSITVFAASSRVAMVKSRRCRTDDATDFGYGFRIHSGGLRIHPAVFIN